MPVSIRFDDLEEAFLWGNTEGRGACISRTTGKAHLIPGDGDPVEDMDPVPDDVDDDALYAAVPDKRDLDLGQRLALRFVEDVLPARLEQARSALHRRGGWRAFKDLLDRAGQLDAWHRFEDAETRAALTAWAESEGFAVVQQPARE